MNPHITTGARRLLQDLTARGALLIYDTEQERFIYAPMHGKDEILIGKRHAAAKEVLHLCAVKTEIKLHPEIRYAISEEGTRILMRPDYIPAIVQARLRQQTPVAGTHSAAQPQPFQPQR